MLPEGSVVTEKARASLSRLLRTLLVLFIGVVAVLGGLGALLPAFRSPWLAGAVLIVAVALWTVAAVSVLVIWGSKNVWPRRGTPPVLRAVRRYNGSLRGWRLLAELAVLLLALVFFAVDVWQRRTADALDVTSGAYGAALLIGLTGVIVTAACVNPGHGPDDPQSRAVAHLPPNCDAD